DFNQDNGCSYSRRRNNYKKAIRKTDDDFSVTEYEIIQIRRN
ncbi:6908_t:CDS:1, partial [Racocetra persica]